MFDRDFALRSLSIIDKDLAELRAGQYDELPDGATRPEFIAHLEQERARIVARMDEADAATTTPTTPTTAERIAERFGNDGQNWTDAEGRALVSVLYEEAESYGFACGNPNYDETDPESGPEFFEVNVNDIRDYTRFIFADGSAIVTADGGWDIEGDTPFKWAGA